VTKKEKKEVAPALKTVLGGEKIQQTTLEGGGKKRKARNRRENAWTLRMPQPVKIVTHRIPKKKDWGFRNKEKEDGRETMNCFGKKRKRFWREYMSSQANTLPQGKRILLRRETK